MRTFGLCVWEARQAGRPDWEANGIESIKVIGDALPFRREVTALAADCGSRQGRG